MTKVLMSGAVISPCGKFRPRLWRVWSEARRLVVIMLNPSTADASKDDNTIKWLMRWADRNGYGGIEVMNVYDYRATDPRELKRAGYPMSEMNHEAIAAVAKACGSEVVCAWGAHARTADVKHLLRVLELRQIMLTYFKMNTGGSPSHPLYLPGDVELTEWRWEDWSRLC